jgi:hypothetical protein
MRMKQEVMCNKVKKSAARSKSGGSWMFVYFSKN